MRTGMFSTSAIALAILGFCIGANATPLINNTGLLDPLQTLTFSEVVLPQESLVTDEFAAFGVNFAPGLFYDTQNIFFPTQSLANFQSNGTLNNPASILFSNIVSAAAFAVQTNSGTTTFTALLNNVIVESFTAPTTLSVLPDTSQASNFYGFTDIAFDEIRVLSNTSFFQIDNLQYSAVVSHVVPEPGILALLMLGFTGLYAARRRGSRG